MGPQVRVARLITGSVLVHAPHRDCPRNGLFPEGPLGQARPAPLTAARSLLAAKDTLVASPRRNSPRKGPSVVRRPADAPRGLRHLPPEVEDLAAGRSEYLKRQRRPDGRISDARVAGLIPGVPNHEARRVFDARVDRLRAAVAAQDEPALERLLHELSVLGLWRARNVQGLDALCEGVIGLPTARGEELLKRAEQTRGPADRLPESAVALWVRSEAALLNTCDHARIEVQLDGDALKLQLSVPLATPELAADALMAIGHNARGLGQAFVPERRTPKGPRER